MAFKHDGKHAKRWHDWVNKHRDELARCGVADWLYVDELRWNSLLEEGYDTETGWSPSWLPKEQAELLNSFIIRECSDAWCFLIVSELKRHLESLREQHR
jgi:hypothetical protein